LEQLHNSLRNLPGALPTHGQTVRRYEQTEDSVAVFKALQRIVNKDTVQSHLPNYPSLKKKQGRRQKQNKKNSKKPQQKAEREATTTFGGEGWVVGRRKTKQRRGGAGDVRRA
jgi:hypothetical protein